MKEAPGFRTKLLPPLFVLVDPIDKNLIDAFLLGEGFRAGDE
jgi:hypothetical protein